MGYKFWQWLVAATLLACAAFCSAQLSLPSSLASAATPDTVAADNPKPEQQKGDEGGEEKAGETETNTAEKPAGENPQEAQKTETEESEELPLDLGAGSPAPPESTGTEELGSGVTVTGGKPGTVTSPTGSSETGTGGDALKSHPLWTPNSDRFLLGDRQADLSLTPTEQPKPEAPSHRRPAPATAKPPAAPATGAPETRPAPPITGEEQPLEIPRDPAAGEGGITGDLPEIPSGEEGDPVSLREHFTDAELADPDSDSILLPPVDATEQDPGTPVGPTEDGTDWAATIPGATTDNSRTLREALEGGEDDPAIGENVVSLSPWRVAAVFLACLGLVFLAAWMWGKFRGRGFGLAKRSLAVIETIGIGPGKQIVIVEMNEDALVLGVTPHSINLLDKVPLATLNSSYSGMVNTIIENEGTPLPGQWEERPRFAPPSSPVKLAPPLAATTYRPTGNGKIKVSEMRKARSAPGPAPAGIPTGVAAWSGRDAAKSALIDRVRLQIKRLEE